MLGKYDWLHLGQVRLGRWSAKDRWGAVTSRRRGAAEPLWTSGDTPPAGRPKHLGSWNRRGGHCYDLLSPSQEHFPGRHRRGGSCPPVLWRLPVRASGTGARGVPVSNGSPICHSPRKPLQDITTGTVGSAKIERIWLSLEHLKIQASGLLTQL